MTALKLVAFAVIGFVSFARQDKPDWAKMLGETKFTLSEAAEKGLKEAGEGVAIHAELESDEGKAVYSIDIAQGEKNCGVVLDVKDGKVLEKEVEDEDNSSAAKACKITLTRAIESALKHGAGKAVEAEILMRDSKPVVCVKVFADGKLANVNIDGITGDVLKAGQDEKAEAKFTESFGEDDKDLATTGTNPFFVLEIGYVLQLSGDEGDEKDVAITITVLDETKKIGGIDCRVVEESESVGGELRELTRDYFAISKRTNNVYYMGEDVDVYKGGKVVGHEGSWLHGENKAHYGLMMPGSPLLGARHYQEIAPGVGMDRAEIVSLSEKFDCPAGKFENVLKVVETTPLEKGRESKLYARGVGLVFDGGLKLTKYGKNK